MTPRFFARFGAPILAAAVAVASAAAHGETLPPGFRDSIVISGLTRPTVVRFSPDGRIFVAEKSGIVKVFSSLTATTPTIFANLTTNVDNYWDRGLLGMALDPGFPTNPYVYVLYAYDAPIGGTAPPAPARAGGMMEIMLPNGVSLRVDADVDGPALRRVLDALGRR